MDDFVNHVNRQWETADPVALSTFVLWRLNNIHPFINGNGRTARAASYFVLCLKAGGWLPGGTILPELLRRERPEYIAGLEEGHSSSNSGGPLDLSRLHRLMVALLDEQINGNPYQQPGATAAGTATGTP